MRDISNDKVTLDRIRKRGRDYISYDDLRIYLRLCLANGATLEDVIEFLDRFKIK